MKRLITFLFIIVLSMPQLAYSQGSRQQQRSEWYKKVQNAKIAFFTTEIELTTKEATEFWPLYNEFWLERERANRKAQHALRGISRVLDGKERANDAQLNELIETYITGEITEGEIIKTYYPRFLEILSIEKVARMFKAEEDFRIKMIHDLRSGRHE